MTMNRTYMRPVINPVETGKRLRALRVSSGFSVRDIQNVFGFEHPQAVYSWEYGVNVPTVDNLLVLSTLFNVELKDLLVTTMVENQLSGNEKMPA